MPNKKRPMDLGKLVSYYKPYKALFVADLLSSALVSAFGLILPLCVRQVTNAMLEAGAADILPGIFRMGGLMLALLLAKTGVGIFYDYKGHDMGAMIERDLRRELFEHYQKLPFSFFDQRDTGELLSRLTNDLHNLSEFYHHVPELVFRLSIQIIGAGCILVAIHWRLALVVFGFFPVILAYAAVFYRRMQGAYAANRQRIADINSTAEETLSGIRTVKAFANEDVETAKFSLGNGRYYASRSGIYRSEALFYSVIEHLFAPLITVAIVLVGGIWLAQDALDVGSLLLFLLYAAYLTEPVTSLASVLPFYQEGWSGYSRFRQILDTAPTILDKEGAPDLQAGQGLVAFENVSFRYGEDGEYLLRNINLEVRHGETVAIVGRSGIGKTTLCSLIPRFYDVCEGAVRVAGADVRDVAQKSLRRQIGVVRQESFLFSGTVLENILYGRPGATREEAIEAAKKANAHGFILGLPKGYDTETGPRGVRLSGGQRQRICIARVFLKDPMILILDEATSALDYESERAVMESLRALAQGRTTLIIAHRLSTIQNADRILVLADGGIAEQGTHQALYARGGEYARLYSAREA